MPERWLVTGAGGFLATNFTANVGFKNIEITGQARNDRYAKAYDNFLVGDLRDFANLMPAIRALRPDVIVHAAAISGHETAERDRAQATTVNVEVTGQLAQIAEDIGSKFVFISTDAVFSGESGGYLESDAVSPFSFYGETKVLGEQRALNSCATSLIIRTNFFGWSSTKSRSVLEFFVNSYRDRQSIFGYPDFIVTSTYVQTLINNIHDLVDLDTSGIVNVVSSDPCSKYEFGLLIAEAFAFDKSLISPQPADSGNHLISRTRDLSLRTELLQSLLGRTSESQFAGICRARDDEATVGSQLRSILLGND